MAEKVVTKKSFIGGRIVLPGETVDVDAKGDLVAAPSTPIGNLTLDQLRAALASREENERKRSDPVPEFGRNVADPSDANTGTQPLPMANVRPGDGSAPQVIPSGAEEHRGQFVRPAPADAPAAVEVVVGAAAVPATEPGEHRQVGLTGKNKDQLLEIAADEGVEVPEGATNEQIRDAIEAKRNDA